MNSKIGIEEISSVPTQATFFPEQKAIEDATKKNKKKTKKPNKLLNKWKLFFVRWKWPYKGNIYNCIKQKKYQFIVLSAISIKGQKMRYLR